MSSQRGSGGGAPAALVALSLLTVLSNCAARQPVEVSAPIRTVAILPIEATVTERSDEEAEQPLPRDAGSAVTAAIYGVLSERPHLRFVADLTLAEALKKPEVRAASDAPARALAVGKAVGADGVIFGKVWRFRERVGTEFGATVPAAVSFELSVLEVATDKVVWTGQFDYEQEPLSSNVLNFWMYWSGGPRWFTARELARLGVEKLHKDYRRLAQ